MTAASALHSPRATDTPPRIHPMHLHISNDRGPACSACGTGCRSEYSVDYELARKDDRWIITKGALVQEA